MKNRSEIKHRRAAIDTLRAAELDRETRSAGDTEPRESAPRESQGYALPAAQPLTFTPFALLLGGVA